MKYVRMRPKHSRKNALPRLSGQRKCTKLSTNHHTRLNKEHCVISRSHQVQTS